MMTKLLAWYDKNYKGLMIIPLLLFVFSVAGLSYQLAVHGDIVNKGISLTGGTAITVETQETIDEIAIESTFKEQFPQDQLISRSLTLNGRIVGYTFESNILDESFKAFIEQQIPNVAFSTETTGPTLGADFFVQMQIAILLALVLMGIVVFIAFRDIIPSVTIIIAVVMNLIVTLTVFDLSNQTLTAAGVAAFLMMIGYTVDTNILLTSRVLRSHDMIPAKRIHSAAKTGLFMTLTTLTTLIVAESLTNSQVISQIMFVLIVGQCADLLTTWIMNAGILLWYVERKGAKYGK